jgi:hypothetical protein
MKSFFDNFKPGKKVAVLTYYPFRALVVASKGSAEIDLGHICNETKKIAYTSVNVQK